VSDAWQENAVPKPSVILAIVFMTLASFAVMAAAQDRNGMALHKAAARDDAATIKALLSRAVHVGVESKGDFLGLGNMIQDAGWAGGQCR
jgi:hypothetical protein